MNLRLFFSKIKQEILWKNLGFALLSLLPILFFAFWFHEPLIIRLGLIDISLFIAATRLQSDYKLIILHYFLILIGFSFLYFSINTIGVFVVLCALMAFASILITRHGANLRTLGNYTFIPAVYLACEIRHGLPEGTWVHTYLKFIAWSTLALVIILLLQYFFHIFKTGKSKIVEIQSYWRKMLAEIDKGEPFKEWLQPGIAIFIGVFVAALLVTLLHMDNAEWLIWSTASVITTDLYLSRTKLLHRFSGALIGVAIGLCVGVFLPQSELIYSLAILGIMLTLISFKTYFIAFSTRCFFVALAASAISKSPHVAFTRVENVFIGGVIGLTSVYLTHYFFKSKN